MVADADLQRTRRERVKSMVDKALPKYRLRPLSGYVRYPWARRYRRRADHNRRPLAYSCLDLGCKGRQRYLLRKTVQYDHRREPHAGPTESPDMAESIKPERSAAASKISNLRPIWPISGKLGELKEVHADILAPLTHNPWLPAEPEPAIDDCDWNRWPRSMPMASSHQKYVEGGWRGVHRLSTAEAVLRMGLAHHRSVPIRGLERMIRRRSNFGPITTILGSTTPTGATTMAAPKKPTSSTAAMPTALSS